jgi:phosphoglycolate phosphatase-like HAD superfamily hydrolase
MTLSSTADDDLPVAAVETNAHNLRRVKGMIFDIDGTLADSWRLGYDATLTVLERHNIPPITPEIYHSCTRYATPERLARHAGHEPGHPLFEQVGRQLAEEFDDLYVSLVTTETAGLYSGILPFLQRIPDDVAVGALTNAAVRYAHAVLRTNCPAAQTGGKWPSIPADASSGLGAIYGRFRSIRGADDVPAPKPSPEGLWQVCRDLQLKPSDCVYVGDSPTDGVAAHAAGMPSVGVLWGSHSRESLSRAPFTCLVSTIQELEGLILDRPEAMR